MRTVLAAVVCAVHRHRLGYVPAGKSRRESGKSLAAIISVSDRKNNLEESSMVESGRCCCLGRLPVVQHRLVPLLSSSPQFDEIRVKMTMLAEVCPKERTLPQATATSSQPPRLAVSIRGGDR